MPVDCRRRGRVTPLARQFTKIKEKYTGVEYEIDILYCPVCARPEGDAHFWSDHTELDESGKYRIDRYTQSRYDLLF